MELIAAILFSIGITAVTLAFIFQRRQEDNELMEEYLKKRIKTLSVIVRATSDKKLKERCEASLREVEQALIVYNGGTSDFIELALTEKL